MSINKSSATDSSLVPDKSAPPIIIPNHSAPPIIIPNQSLFKELAGLEKVNINQRTSCLDYIFPLCTPNKYEVLNYDTNEILYEFKEESECFERACCYTCRGFLMKINNIVTSNNNISVLLEGTKPFGVGLILYFGCQKPKIFVNVKTPQGFILGKIAMNWNSCCCPTCSTQIEIIDNTGKLIYIIRANSFAIGIYCCCHCTKCFEILYHIIQNDIKVGKMKKLTCDSCRICWTKGDQFSIFFPPQATPEEKMLLIIGCILIDYQSFFL